MKIEITRDALTVYGFLRSGDVLEVGEARAQFLIGAGIARVGTGKPAPRTRARSPRRKAKNGD